MSICGFCNKELTSQAASPLTVRQLLQRIEVLSQGLHKGLSAAVASHLQQPRSPSHALKHRRLPKRPCQKLRARQRSTADIRKKLRLQRSVPAVGFQDGLGELHKVSQPSESPGKRSSMLAITRDMQGSLLFEAGLPRQSRAHSSRDFHQSSWPDTDALGPLGTRLKSLVKPRVREGDSQKRHR